MSLQLLHEVQHEARRLRDVHAPEAAGAPQVRVDNCADQCLVHVIEVPKISFDDEEYTMTGCEQAARLLAPSTVFNRCGEVVRALPLLACVALFRYVACSLSGHLQSCEHAPHKHERGQTHNTMLSLQDPSAASVVVSARHVADRQGENTMGRAL